MTGKAHLKLKVAIKDRLGKVVLEKSYIGDGSGHLPIYLNEQNQKVQVSKTAQEAFRLVFSEIAKDVKELKFN